MISWKEVEALIQAAKTELLASDLRKEFTVTYPEDATYSQDDDFLYQVWSSNKDDDVWAASPSLKKALVAYCQYRADDILGDFDEILSNVDGRNRLVLFDMDDFDERCQDEWVSKKERMVQIHNSRCALLLPHLGPCPLLPGAKA